MPQASTFENIEIGQKSESYSYRLTRGKILQYLEALEYDVPAYWKNCLDNPPAAMLANDVGYLPIMAWLVGEASADRSAGKKEFLHAKHEIDFLNPPRAGMKITVEGHIADKYEARGRYWVVVEAVSKDENGVELVRCRSTQTWLI